VGEAGRKKELSRFCPAMANVKPEERIAKILPVFWQKLLLYI
jgi:hypothetical protein